MIPYFFTEVKCKGNTQITHMEETEKCHRVIRLMLVQAIIFSLDNYYSAKVA